MFIKLLEIVEKKLTNINIICIYRCEQIVFYH